MRNWIAAVRQRVRRLFGRPVDAAEVSASIEETVGSMAPQDALRYLFSISNRIYTRLGQEAIRYGEGTHTKHKHIKYHDFFIKNIEVGEKVLDVGCGDGCLTHDIAKQVKDVDVLGVEIEAEKISAAQEKYRHPNLRFVCGDALKDLPDKNYDVVVMSNVLEHIDDRKGLLETIKKKHKPKRFVLRVPLYERDWRVPLMEELGVDYRLDATHKIEYRHGEFEAELASAGLKIKQIEYRWGEAWCVAE